MDVLTIRSPIITYGRKGCTKRGVKARKHGIAYNVGRKPKVVSGEPTLGFRPVAVDISIPEEKLPTQARVNYSKLVTIEHNVSVYFVGRVVNKDFDSIMREAVDRCWEDKSRGRLG